MDASSPELRFLEVDLPGDTPLRRHFENQRRYYDWMRGDRRHALLERAFDWLEASWPEHEGETGVHLGAGLYFGFDGHHHGEWRGDFHLDGERIADCTRPEAARRLHQIRDTTIHVHDEKGGAIGWGTCQPIAAGPWPDLGLDDDAWM